MAMSKRNACVVGVVGTQKKSTNQVLTMKGIMKTAPFTAREERLTISMAISTQNMGVELTGSLSKHIRNGSMIVKYKRIGMMTPRSHSIRNDPEGSTMSLWEGKITRSFAWYAHEVLSLNPGMRSKAFAYNSARAIRFFFTVLLTEFLTVLLTTLSFSLPPGLFGSGGEDKGEEGASVDFGDPDCIFKSRLFC